MIFIVFRKMLQNKWLSICLFLGFVLAVATVSSIPMFTRGASFNEYMKSLRNSQASSRVYPGSALVGKGLTPVVSSDYAKTYAEADKLVKDEMVARLGLPVEAQVKYLKADSSDIYLFKTGNLPKRMSLSSLSDLEDHVRVITGRINNPGITGDTIEAVITATDMVKHQLVLNKPYDVKSGTILTARSDEREFRLSLKVVITGVVEPTSENDPYWFFNFVGYNQDPVLYIDQDSLMKTFFIEKPFINFNAQWYSAFDYNKINIDSMDTIKTFSGAWEGYRKAGKITQLDIPIEKMYSRFTQSEKVLTNIMWLFNMLILVILTFYILMISKLIIEYDKNEIALITSRGGGKLHILKGYLVQGLIIGIAALAIGPFLGMVICRIIGSSNSFMEFTNRKAIPAVLNTQVYLYCIITLLAIIAVMLITSVLFSKTSIIEYKQGKGRSKNRYIILRIILSLGLLAFSIYWLLSYESLAKRAGGFIPNAQGLPIDPMLFLNAALFIIGSGLFLINLFPYIVRLVFVAGKKIWPTSVYTAFVQIGRSAGQEQFLMLFIVLTLSIGVFSANSARTINMNATDAIRYQSGADITLKGNWKYIADENAPTAGDLLGASMGSSDSQAKIQSFKQRSELGLLTDKYIEPDFKQYAGLKGVENVAKVYAEESTTICPKLTMATIRFLAVNTDEFGKVAWFRPQLLPYHWYEYLNLLADNPEGVLLSSSFKQRNVKVGDEIVLKIAGKQEINVVVCDFIDYWPSYTPKKVIDSKTKTDNYLIVANYNYIFNNIPQKPYEVWIGKTPGYSGADILAEMKDKGIEPQIFNDTDTKIAQMKREPAVLGTNGSLTFGFILTMIICLSGFLIYWVMSLKKRSLQFGVMRAMGISSGNVIGMLSFEHLLTSGSAILAGISVGAIASRVFIPVYELFYNTGSQALPFRVVAQRADYVRLYAVVAVMLLTAFSILYMITRNIKVTQAVKLGED